MFVCVVVGSLFGDTTNSYYQLDGAQDWNSAPQAQYGQPVPTPQAPQQQSFGLVGHHGLDGAHQPTAASNQMGLYGNVSSPTSSLSSLPPMSTFSNRSPQVTASGYGPTNAPSATTTIMLGSPNADIKPNLTSLYPSSNSEIKPELASLYPPTNIPPPQPEHMNPQWTMHRSGSSLHSSYNDKLTPNEVTHLHQMVRFNTSITFILSVTTKSFVYLFPLSFVCNPIVFVYLFAPFHVCLFHSTQ